MAVNFTVSYFDLTDHNKNVELRKKLEAKEIVAVKIKKSMLRWLVYMEWI